MALSHAVSYQNMSLHPPTPVPFFDKIKSAPCYSEQAQAWSLPCNGTAPQNSLHRMRITTVRVIWRNKCQHFMSQILYSDSNNRRNQMLKTVWIAFVAFSTPEECDQFLKTNPSLTHGEIQCVIHKHEMPAIKPKRKPK